VAQPALKFWVQDLAGGTEPRCVTADEVRSVHIFSWTHDSRWLLYLQDNGGDEHWHVYRVDPDDPDGTAVDLPRSRGRGPPSNCSRPDRARPLCSTMRATRNSSTP
jgi:hypothetical protein